MLDYTLVELKLEVIRSICSTAKCRASKSSDFDTDIAPSLSKTQLS